MHTKWLPVSLVFFLLIVCARPEAQPPEAQSSETPVAVEEVPAAVEQVEIVAVPASLTIGDIHHFQAQIDDTRGEKRTDIPVVWSSSDPTILKISSDGMASAEAAGTATITAQASDKAASLQVAVVMPSIKEVRIRPARSSIKVGETQQFKVVVLDTRRKERGDVQITWITPNPSVATAIGSGRVIGTGPGSTTVTATTEGKTASATLTVIETPTAVKTETKVPEATETAKRPEPVAPKEGAGLTVSSTEKSPLTAEKVEVAQPAATTPPEPVASQAQVAQAPATPPPAVQRPTTPPAAKPSSEVDEKKKEKLERIKKKLKDVDPSKVIYLDSRGNIASTGSPNSIAGEAYKAGSAEHAAAMELAELPKDRFGLVNWWKALEEGKINPVDSLEKGTASKRPLPIPDLVIRAKSKTQSDVVFSHKIHTSWIPKCEVCHEGIFKQKAGGNPEMHMTKIAAGQYCGRCHNRVAFPLEDCKRCHVKEKGSDRPASVVESPGQP